MEALRLCFANAMAASFKHGWRYVEGVALSIYPPAVPLHHAWNLDADGAVVDLTWRPLGRAYYGVEFNPGRADDATWNGDATILDDKHRGWPVLKEPWAGEDFVREWTMSDALRTRWRSRRRKPTKKSRR